VIEVPIAHGEGRFEIGEAAHADLVADDRVLFRYCDADGTLPTRPTPTAPPTTSPASSASVSRSPS